MSWSVADIPSLAGKRAIVTGSNSGIGFEAALALAGAGAETIVAGAQPGERGGGGGADQGLPSG